MAAEHKDSLLKNIVRYSSSNIYRQILGIINAFIRPKLLTPELYGLWNLLSLIIDYTNYSDLGSRTSMRFLIPYNKARGEAQKVSDIKSSVFYGTLYLRLILVSGLLLTALLTDFSLEVKWGLITIATVVMIRWYYLYYISLLKSYQNFKLISQANYLRTSIAVFMGIVLIYFFNIYGVYVTAIVSYLAVTLFLKSKYHPGRHTVFKFPVFFDLVKKGFPIIVFNLFVLLLRSSDRIIVASFLGIKQLGYYGIVGIVFSFFMQIPGASREVIEPRLMESLGKNSPEENLKEYFFKPLFNTAYYIPFLIGPIFFLFPLLIPLILPRYTPAIVPTQIIILGGYFLSMAYVTRGIIVANNWQLKASVVVSCVLPINIFLSIFLLKIGLGINGVAIGSSTSFFVLFVVLLIFIKRKCDYVNVDWGSNIIGICLPFPLMSGIIIIQSYMSSISIINNYLAVFLNLIIFCFFMFLIIRHSKKKYTLLQGINLKKYGKIDK
jgi:O-antigen/teichoic acid export membrane protein